MPVIINEVEIKVEEPPATQARGGGNAEQPPPASSPSKIKPEEIHAVMRVNRERMERLRAD